MNLTGKAKEDFNDYLDSLERVVVKNTSNLCVTFPYNFEQLSPSMRYGVYVDWFDSVGYPIDIEPTIKGTFLVFFIRLDCTHINGKSYNSRPEARTAAIEKANEIYNERYEKNTKQS